MPSLLIVSGAGPAALAYTHAVVEAAADALGAAGWSVATTQLASCMDAPQLVSACVGRGDAADGVLCIGAIVGNPKEYEVVAQALLGVGVANAAVGTPTPVVTQLESFRDAAHLRGADAEATGRAAATRVVRLASALGAQAHGAATPAPVRSPPASSARAPTVPAAGARTGGAASPRAAAPATATAAPTPAPTRAPAGTAAVPSPKAAYTPAPPPYVADGVSMKFDERFEARAHVRGKKHVSGPAAPPESPPRHSGKAIVPGRSVTAGSSVAPSVSAPFATDNNKAGTSEKLAATNGSSAAAGAGAGGAAAATSSGSGDPRLEAILAKLRAQLLSHGARGIAGLGRKFRIIDDDGNKSLSAPEFRKAMHELDMGLSDADADFLFDHFNGDDDQVSYDEFLVAIRGVLNARRLAMVQMAFKVLDADGSGVVTMSDVMGRYDASKHPEVVAGRRTASDVLLEFIQSFEVGDEKDGLVHPHEFERYYANISASVDDDDYFELMIRNAWHISGGEGWSANTANRRVLVVHTDGRQTVEEIKNDLGLGSDITKIKQRLREQGVSDILDVSLDGDVDSFAADAAAANAANASAPSSPEPQSSRRSVTASSIVFG